MSIDENTTIAATGTDLAKPLIVTGLAAGVGLALTGTAVALSVVGLGAELPKKLFAGLAMQAGRGGGGAHARKLLGHGGRRFLSR